MGDDKERYRWTYLIKNNRARDDYGQPLEIAWPGVTDWQVTVPVAYGDNPLTLEAYDFQGNLIATDAISVQSTAVASPTTLDLSGVRLADGVSFDFTGSDVTVLGPGQFVLVVRNRAAFELRYGLGLPIADARQTTTPARFYHPVKALVATATNRGPS